MGKSREATKLLHQRVYDIAAKFTRPSPLWSYYNCLAELLDELIEGQPDPVDCVPLICYKSMEDDEQFNQGVVVAFKEEWAKEIGWSSVAITSLAIDMKQRLGQV